MQDKEKTKGGVFNALYWWAALVVAVLAIPSIGFIIAATVPEKGIVQLAVFVMSCWVCTFLGMHIMKK